MAASNAPGQVERLPPGAGSGPACGRFVDVVLPLPLPPFTYHDPRPAPAAPLAAGTRVLVPFRRRPTVGFVVACHDQIPEFTTEPLLELLDPHPLLDPSQVALARWLADNSLCGLGEAFQVMIPGGLRWRVRRLVKLLVPATAGLPAGLGYLRGRRAMPVEAWRQQTGVTATEIDRWLAEGWIAFENRLDRGGAPRERRVVNVAADRPLVPERLTPKERQVVEALLAEGGARGVHELARLAGVSTAPVLQLLAKGVLTASVERSHRQPVSSRAGLAPMPAPPALTAEQASVLALLRRSFATDRKPVLVRGVTCSGKTEIYLRFVGELLAAGHGAIVLVPEIALTPQMLARFSERFGDEVAVLHSRLSAGERFDQWELIRQGRRRVVVGARSAVFAPLPRLGAIILDEEGEPSFKQDSVPRYHAREVAAERCRAAGALLVMGSATPTMEAFARGESGQYHLVHLTRRVTDRRPPAVEVVDMRSELMVKRNRSVFSDSLQRALVETIGRGEQAILFLNRRGHSSFVLCRACGRAVGCSRCQVSLVFHERQQVLRCHYCGEARSQPRACPTCGSDCIRYFGSGTERIESEVRRLLPAARVQRLDSDAVATRGSLESALDRFGRRELDILVGTQMVAKGLDFPEVTLVGIVAADSVLRLPDFRAAERTFALLAQVAGRAGRGSRPGRVILQTYDPDHHAVRCAVTEDYLAFVAEEAAARRATGFPPFSRLLGFLLAANDRDRVRSAAVDLVERLRAGMVAAGGAHPPPPAGAVVAPANALAVPSILDEVWGPAPAAIEVIRGHYRMQVLVKSSDLGRHLPWIGAMLAGFRPTGVQLAVDCDPYFVL